MIYTQARLRRFVELHDEVRLQHPEENHEEHVARSVYRLNHLHPRVSRLQKRLLILGSVLLLLLLAFALSAHAQTPDVNIDRVGGVLQTTDTLKVNCTVGCGASSGGASAITLVNAQLATGSVTGAAVTIPGVSAVGTLYATFATITGSPSGCTVQIVNYDSLANAVNNGSAISVSVANGTTAIAFSPASNLITASQMSATFSCGVYASTGTVSISYVPGTATDRKVSGPDSQATTQTQGPVEFGGRFYSDGTTRTLATDTNGNLQMGVVGTVTLGNLPQQPFLNTTDFSDVVASSPVRGGIIVANSTPKWAQVAVGANGAVLSSNGTDLSWTTQNLLNGTILADTNASAAALGGTLYADAANKWQQLVGSTISAGGGFINETQATLAAPSAPALTISNTGGSITNASNTTVFVQITFVNAFGETTGSTETSALLNNANGCLTGSTTCKVTVTHPTLVGNATGYTVYDYTISGKERQRISNSFCVGITLDCAINDAAVNVSSWGVPTPVINTASNGTKVIPTWKGANGKGKPVLTDAAQDVHFGGGTPWIDVMASPFNAQCDDATDDAAAFNAALQYANSLGGGFVFVPDNGTNIQGGFPGNAGNCVIKSTLNMASMAGVFLGNPLGQGNPSTLRYLQFQQTGTGDLINMQNCARCGVVGMRIAYLSGSFTGTVIDATSPSPGGNAIQNVIAYNIIGSTGVNTAGRLIDLDGAINTSVHDNELHNAVVAIRGANTAAAGFSNGIRVYNNQFNTGGGGVGDITTAAILNPGWAWDIHGNTFEMGNAAGNLAAIQENTTNIPRVSFVGNIITDCSAGSTSKFFDFGANGGEYFIAGNDMQCANTATLISSTGAGAGANNLIVALYNNDIQQFSVGTTIGANTRLDYRSNNWAGITTFLTGTPTFASYVEDANGAATEYGSENKFGQADIVADSGAINTTDTIIVKTPALAASRVVAGTHFRIVLTGTCTSTVANTSTFTIRWGTLGTTGDGTIAALVTSVAATSGTNNGFRAVIDLTVRVGGATASSSAFLDLTSDGNIGIVATPNAKFLAGTAFNATTASAILSVSYKSAATTTTSTFKNATIEIVQN